MAPEVYDDDGGGGTFHLELENDHGTATGRDIRAFACTVLEVFLLSYPSRRLIMMTSNVWDLIDIYRSSTLSPTARKAEKSRKVEKSKSRKEV